MITKKAMPGSQLVGRASQMQTGAAGLAPDRLGIGFGSIGFTIATLAGSSVETQLVLPTIARRIKGFAFEPNTPFGLGDVVKLELDNQVFVEGQSASSLVQFGELWYYPYQRPYFNNSVFKLTTTTAAAINVNFIVYYES